MQCFLVGGAVRDRLLGLPVKDRDFVVVGATPEEMLVQGFVPVGRDFPVFLHPQTHEEYALARTERKTAPGYKGFAFHAQKDVTLEQDLARRDLTINAMAETEDGRLFDPFNGQFDLRQRLLRHVSPAFQEDPVRILRAARFCARFTEFSIAPATVQLMRMMVDGGEVDALVPERVWQEFSRGLMEIQPSRMLEALQTCGALARLLPVLAQHLAESGGRMLRRLDAAAYAGAALPIRLAVLLAPIATTSVDITAIEVACAGLKIPGDCRDLAIMTARERNVVQGGSVSAQQAMALMERCDALRKPARFHQMLDACAFLDEVDPMASSLLIAWRCALEAALTVNAGPIATQIQQEYPGQPMRINAAIRSARVAAITSINGAT